MASSIENGIETRITLLSELGLTALYVHLPVVDVETTDLLRNVGNDARQLIPSIVGILDGERIMQYCLLHDGRRDEMRKKVLVELESIKKPFIAFNGAFDRLVIFGLTGVYFPFMDIQEYDGQKKRSSIEDKKIVLPFQDPFNGNGCAAVDCYSRYAATGNKQFLEEIIRHNQACLVYELLIAQNLISRGVLRMPH